MQQDLDEARLASSDMTWVAWAGNSLYPPLLPRKDEMTAFFVSTLSIVLDGLGLGLYAHSTQISWEDRIHGTYVLTLAVLTNPQ